MADLAGESKGEGNRTWGLEACTYVQTNYKYVGGSCVNDPKSQPETQIEPIKRGREGETNNRNSVGKGRSFLVRFSSLNQAIRKDTKSGLFRSSRSSSQLAAALTACAPHLIGSDR